MKAIMTIAMTLLVLQLYAADCVWQGASNASWGVAANWSTNSIPTSSDRAIFTAATTINVTGANIDVAGLVFNTSGTYTFSGLAGNINIGSQGIATANATGTVTLADGGNTFNLNGSIAVTAGGVFTHTGIGKIVVQTTGATLGGGTGTITFSNLELAGGINATIIGTNNITITGNLQLNALSNLTLPNAGGSTKTLILGPSTGTTGGTISGTGTLSGGTTNAPAITINGGGAANVGTLYFNTTSTAASTINRLDINRICTVGFGSAFSSTLVIGGGITFTPPAAGNITVNMGGLTFRCAGGPTVNNASTAKPVNVTIQGQGRVQANRSVDGYSLTNIVTAGNTITLADLDVTNTATTASFAANGKTFITGKLTVNRTTAANSMTLNTNDNLVLVSNATTNGYIGDITGNGNGQNVNNNISGKVTIQKYIAGGPSNAVGSVPGRRAFRFLAHPFTNASFAGSGLAPLLAANHIDITGSGSTFTQNPNSGATNNPSAFWYDPSVPGAGSGTVDPGWTAFTAADGSGSNNTWSSGQGIRVLVRGAKGEGLNGGAYTASDVTLSLTGNINTGNQTITLASSTPNSKGWQLIGNPYPAPVNIQAVLNSKFNAGSGNISSVAYVWNPNKSNTSRGGYDAIDISTNGGSNPYILPAMGCVFVESTIPGSHTLSFAETHKSNTAASLAFRNGLTNNTGLTIALQSDNGEVLDVAGIKFKQESKKGFDNFDGTKLLNEYSVYTLSEEGYLLNINTQPLPTKETIIPVAFQTRFTNQPLQLKLYNLPTNDYTIYLKDLLLQTERKVEEGMTYVFQPMATNGKVESKRFELRFVPEKRALPELSTPVFVKITPNPASKYIEVSSTRFQQQAIACYFISGSGQRTPANVQPSSAAAKINVAQLAPGAYWLEVICGTERCTVPFIKE